MIINSISFGIKSDYNTKKESKPKFVSQTLMQKDTLSHLPRPYLPVSDTQMVFRGLKFQNTIVKKVTDKLYQGLGLYTPDGKWLDCSKIGDEFLAKEPLDVKKATFQEWGAYLHANALRESISTWTRRYNKYNMDKMLATFPTLNDVEAEERFGKNLKILWDTRLNKSLDIDITDKKGNLCLDAVVFDTESTGLNIFGHKFKKNSKPLDRIIQIGAIQIKNGKIVPESSFNKLINPMIPIPEKSTEVHGITDEMVKDAKPIEAILKSFLKNHLNKNNGIIVAYNSKFDITILNNAIRKCNSKTSEDSQLKEKVMHKVLDPFILIQRIHPYLGVRKKLGEQYQFLFCKQMENAHDALSDVKATVDVMKYCLYFLSEHRKDKNIPLTLREVLIFQNGGKVKNIDIPFDSERCNAKVNFDKSYLHASIPVVNYFKGYKLTAKMLDEIKDDIGEENYQKIKKSRIKNKMFNLKNSSGLPINPAETELIPKESKFQTAAYLMRKNFDKVLGFAELEAYNGKSKEEIHDFIIEHSKKSINKKAISVWMKNPNPEDIKDGNDLPDFSIIKKVMNEQSA